MQSNLEGFTLSFNWINIKSPKYIRLGQWFILILFNALVLFMVDISTYLHRSCNVKLNNHISVLWRSETVMVNNNVYTAKHKLQRSRLLRKQIVASPRLLFLCFPKCARLSFYTIVVSCVPKCTLRNKTWTQHLGNNWLRPIG